MPAQRYGGEYLIKRIVGLPQDEIASTPGAERPTLQRV
jgi:hypothetical protein